MNKSEIYNKCMICKHFYLFNLSYSDAYEVLYSCKLDGIKNKEKCEFESIK